MCALLFDLSFTLIVQPPCYLCFPVLALIVQPPCCLCSPLLLSNSLVGADVREKWNLIDIYLRSRLRHNRTRYKYSVGHDVDSPKPITRIQFITRGPAGVLWAEYLLFCNRQVLPDCSLENPGRYGACSIPPMTSLVLGAGLRGDLELRTSNMLRHCCHSQ